MAAGYPVLVKLKALSVRQPWASLLLAGVKRYEVRTWRPRDLGLLLVHASSRKAEGIRELRQEPLFQRALRLAELEDESRWPRSALLGVVEVTRIWERGSPPRRLTRLDEYLCGSTEDVYLWQVGRQWVFKHPIPCPGKLSLWTPPGVRRALAAQIRSLRMPLPHS